jgi:hypothetical protein
VEIKSALRAAQRRFRYRLGSARWCKRARRDSGAALRANDSRHAGQIARCCGCRLCAGRRLAAAHARKVGFHLLYVVSGASESQLNDQPKRVCHAGESWYETPVPAIALAAVQARPNPQSCSRFSSSIAMTSP